MQRFARPCSVPGHYWYISSAQNIPWNRDLPANRLGLLVRVAPTGYSLVTQCFEAGADGVMAAQLSSAAEAEEFVRWCKFGPRGRRGLNSSGFDARYMKAQDAELAMRVLEAGYELAFEVSSRVDHYYHESWFRYLCTQAQQGYWRVPLHKYRNQLSW